MVLSISLSVCLSVCHCCVDCYHNRLPDEFIMAHDIFCLCVCLQLANDMAVALQRISNGAPAVTDLQTTPAESLWQRRMKQKTDAALAAAAASPKSAAASPQQQQQIDAGSIHSGASRTPPRAVPLPVAASGSTPDRAGVPPPVPSSTAAASATHPDVKRITPPRAVGGAVAEVCLSFVCCVCDRFVVCCYCSALSLIPSDCMCNYLSVLYGVAQIHCTPRAGTDVCLRLPAQSISLFE